MVGVSGSSASASVPWSSLLAAKPERWGDTGDTDNGERGMVEISRQETLPSPRVRLEEQLRRAGHVRGRKKGRY